MIKIDFDKEVYTCPFCGHAQAYQSSMERNNTGFYFSNGIPEAYRESSLAVFTIKCNNLDCEKICVTTINRFSGKQFDIIPEATFRHFPDYIPQQIRSDYEEACIILNKSPKAAATLLRRCLQGMIRDYWGISKGRLVDEIEELNGKIPASQWKAIDSLRKLGNIGAHMEKDVNLIVDIDEDEALKLEKLIELLLEKWYIARHDEEQLCEDISEISHEKEVEKKK